MALFFVRYHYFLQLKSDVIDGKLNCSIDQAISLAAYSLQAEFGDFDPERHTFEYLKDFAILPKVRPKTSFVNHVFDKYLINLLTYLINLTLSHFV